MLRSSPHPPRYLFLLLILVISVLTASCSAKPAATNTTVTPAPAGNVNWWKEQPDLKKEDTAITTAISQLNTALNAKNVEQALNYFPVEEKDKYRSLFMKSPDVMPILAADLSKATLKYLSVADGQYERIAEYAIQVDGQTFSIVFIKINGQWLLKSL